MEKEREHLVYLARLAEQAERYDGISLFLWIFFFPFYFSKILIIYIVRVFFLFFVFAVLICRCMIFYSF